jgi:YegS/Rv2252/BmrU family lipid kinase
VGGTWLVVNAAARVGGEAADRAEAELRRRGLGVDVRRVVEEPQALQAALAEAVAARPERLLVGGGDGTLSAAANAVADREVVLGVLPLGTGNDFARSLRIPRELEAACAVAAAGAVRRVTAGLANGRVFLNAVSIGVSTEVARRLSPELKRRTGPLAYPLAAGAAALACEPFRLRLEADGERREVDALQVVIGNGRYHGGGTLVAPGATLDDDRLDAWVMAAAAPGEGAVEQARNAWLLARIGLLLRRGRHLEHPGVAHRRCREIAIEATPAQEVNADGELLGETPLRCRIAPGLLRVLAPPA